MFSLLSYGKFVKVSKSIRDGEPMLDPFKREKHKGIYPSYGSCALGSSSAEGHYSEFGFILPIILCFKKINPSFFISYIDSKIFCFRIQSWLKKIHLVPTRGDLTIDLEICL